MSTIGKRLKEVRKQFNVTQDGLGELLGVKNAAISKFETDRVIPSESQLKLICSTYHVHYLWLTEGKGPMLEEETAEDMIERVMAGHSEFAISVMKAFAKLPDEEWYKLRDMIDKIKKEGLS